MVKEIKGEKVAKEELLIIDGTALLFKMYFAKFNQVSNSGVEVGGVIGVSRAIVKQHCLHTVNARSTNGQHTVIIQSTHGQHNP